MTILKWNLVELYAKAAACLICLLITGFGAAQEKTSWLLCLGIPGGLYFGWLVRRAHESVTRTAYEDSFRRKIDELSVS